MALPQCHSVQYQLVINEKRREHDMREVAAHNQISCQPTSSRVLESLCPAFLSCRHRNSHLTHAAVSHGSRAAVVIPRTWFR